MNSVEQFVFEENGKRLDLKWEDFAKEIMALQSPDTFTMLYATDVHYIRKYAFYAIVYSKLLEMVQFSGHIGADLLALTGDIVDGNTTLQRQYRDLYDVISLVRQAKTGSIVVSKGNHDDNSWYTYARQLGTENIIDGKQWFNHVVNPLRISYPMVLDPENPEGGYYYIDDPFHKIRIININTNDTPIIPDEEGRIPRAICGQWVMGLQQKQLSWLAKSLQIAEPGWSVLCMSHMCPFLDAGEPIYNGDMVRQLLLAYRDGGKGTLTGDAEFFPATVEFDFTGNGSHDMMPYFYGHIHKDTVEVVDGITAIASRNLMGKTPGTNADAWDNPEDSFTYCGSWDCVLVDKKQRTVTVKRYNMPECDRMISY